jgi:hypothetical protein
MIDIGKHTFHNKYYTHKNIAAKIDMGRGIKLSGCGNMVKIEIRKRKRCK